MMVVIDFLCNPIKNTDRGCSKAILDPGKPVTDMNSSLMSLNGTGISPYWTMYFISIHIHNGSCHTGVAFFV